MTRKAAMTEAKRRWGDNGTVKQATCSMFKNSKGLVRCTAFGVHSKECEGGIPYFEVGYRGGLGDFFHYFSVQGSGESYEDAFRKHDERKAADDTRIKQLVEERALNKPVKRTRKKKS